MNTRKMLARILFTGSAIFVAAVALTACGEVVVFGHVVREGSHEANAEAGPVKPAPAPSAAAQPAAPAPASANAAAVETSARPVAAVEFQKLRTVVVALTADAAAKAKEDSKFNADALLSAITTELQKQQVLDESGASAIGQITIDDYTFHPTTNVILFGKTYHSGALSGVIRVSDAQGNELSNRRVETRAKIAIPEEGEVVNPLLPLYQAFARQTASMLTGKAAKSQDSDEAQSR